MSYSSFKRWMYRGNRPHLLARMLNRFWAIVHSTGVVPNWVTLEVKGRKTGKAISFPLAMVNMAGDCYLVSMLGEEASWVRNVRAGNGYAKLIHGKREQVQLVEVPVDQRPPILKEYLRIAPGARPHIPVDKDASLEEFAGVAGKIPVFRIKIRD